MQGTQLLLDFDAPPLPHATQPLPPPAELTLLSPVTLASGEKAKARDLLSAIRTLLAVEHDRRAATTQEKQILARFPGFGPVALSLFPDPITGRYKDASWQTIGEDLKSLLTSEEYASARRTTFNAFYTSPVVIAAMHQALTRLGVPEDARILEPGCGTGNFMAGGSPNMRWIGVELDGISGRIGRALHPGCDIRIENFRDSKLPEGSLDAAIGNVPFADLKLDYHGQKLALHDFFFARSLDALKPGGVLALLSSHFTLDKQNGAVRELLADKADFLGAIRLPSEAFAREGTRVVTDIVFLRKRAPGETACHADPDWLKTEPVDIEGQAVSINSWFVHHPEMVLGKYSRRDTLYRDGYSVTGSGDLAGQLREAISHLPESEVKNRNPETTPLTLIRPQHRDSESSPAFVPPPLAHVTEGSFFVAPDRAIRQIEDGKPIPVVYGGIALTSGGALTGRRMAALIGLRDLARRVLQSQNEGRPEEARSDARRDLNLAYDRFTAAFGPINKTTFSSTADGTVIRRMPNLVKFREDPDAMLVMSLEDYDETTGKATKAAILQKDVVGPAPAITRVASAEEGLLVSLDRRGAVDLPFIASLYGKPEAEIIAELGDLIYLDPASGS
jgi:SAM-dependent methyltransferase